MKLLEEIRNTATGAAILAEWLGEGGFPVSQSQANERALVCADCPENRAALWWETAKNSIADAIKSHVEVKSQLKLKVAVEDKIAMCHLCGCANRLKVWVPIEHIAKHLPETVKQTLPAECWMKLEMETHAI